MTVISIEGLWKEYRLGVIGHGTLRHDLQSWWARLRGKEDPNAKITPWLAQQKRQIEGDCFWALRDINLEVKEGELLGIIGRNGAGKSTLLKILSRVTAPTKGQIKIKGRIASLLEVGTGFHPELTGRENIFMNGAVLGMSKQEIRAKLDEIIAFSGVEDFIDTPVKRYSSGMYVRLAFAVAAHLEPEILVVDEVLAVGDAEFQKKCLGKMGDVSQAGRTVLLVSHNLLAIERLCSQAVCIDAGTIACQGRAEEVVQNYQQSFAASDLSIAATGLDEKHRRGNGKARFTGITTLDAARQEKKVFASGDVVYFNISFKVLHDISTAQLCIMLFSEKRERLMVMKHLLSAAPLAAGLEQTALVAFDSQGLNKGCYPLYYWLGAGPEEAYDVVDALTAPLVLTGEEQAGIVQAHSSLISVHGAAAP